MKDVIGIPKYIELAKRAGLPVIVGGRRGPTGKTFLCNALREAGIDAHEEWEFEEGEVKQDAKCYLLILLNELLPDEIVRGSFVRGNGCEPVRYRRFKPKTDDVQLLAEVERIVRAKGLTRHEMMAIVSAFEVRSQ